jgi:3-methyladenine DNA glycosylase AlkD
MVDARDIQKKLKSLANKDKAKILQGFFKTGPGEYGEGDIFIGVNVPVLRKVAAEYRDISFTEVRTLLKSKIHEERLVALLILVAKYSRGAPQEKKRVYELYLKSTRYINNWDLVDVTAGHIVGDFLMDKSKKPLYDLAESKSLWERRIAIIATSAFIKRNVFSHTLKISAMLMRDDEDLIHKAVGWMLREVGKRDLQAEEKFLKKHYSEMPRTALRYAIERFPEAKRKRYLKGEI